MTHDSESRGGALTSAQSIRRRQRHVEEEKRSVLSVLDKFGIAGKVAVVTGASSGLGVAFALAFLEAGADLALGGRHLGRLEMTRQRIEQIGRHAIAVQVDVTKPEECQELADEAVRGAT